MSEDKEEINVTINVKRITKVVGFVVKNWHFVILLFGGLISISIFLKETYEIHKTYPEFQKKVYNDSVDIFWANDRIDDMSRRIESDSSLWVLKYENDNNN